MSDPIDVALENLKKQIQNAASASSVAQAAKVEQTRLVAVIDLGSGTPDDKVAADKAAAAAAEKAAKLRSAAAIVASAAEDLFNAASAADAPPAQPVGDPMLDAAQKVAVARKEGECAVLWGYLSPIPDIHEELRLYLSANLDEYLLIENKDKVAEVPLKSRYRPLAGSFVWVKANAIIKRVREETAADEGEFLKGSISKGFLQSLNVSSMLGLTDLNKPIVDAGSGGGCGSTVAATTGCPG